MLRGNVFRTNVFNMKGMMKDYDGWIRHFHRLESSIINCPSCNERMAFEGNERDCICRACDGAGGGGGGGAVGGEPGAKPHCVCVLLLG